VAPKAILFWSSGKDSAMALHRLRKTQEVDVVGLLTTIDEATRMVAFHRVSEVMVEAQAKAMGLPLSFISIPNKCPNAEYETRVLQALRNFHHRVEWLVFGDLFLEDIRQYRENFFKNSSFKPIFPLWGADTLNLSREIIQVGIKAVITGVDPIKLDPQCIGKPYDEVFLMGLDPITDPCGENGEFHTFVWDSPEFSKPIDKPHAKVC